MDSKAIETLSISAVRDSIVVTENLDQCISDNDKEPSWDGFVYLYRTPQKNKKNLKGRVAVQVKGVEKNNLSNKSISFPVTIIDLNNYLNDGGIIFFVVYVADEVKKQIYYAELSPVKLNKLLEETGNQKTKNIKFKQFPRNNDEKVRIFFKFWNDCRRQLSFSNGYFLSYDDFKNNREIEEVIMPVTTLGKIDSQRALLTDEVYLYARLKGSSMLQPFDFMVQNQSVRMKSNVKISVNNHLFYEHISVVKYAKTIKYIFGESFSVESEYDSDIYNIHYKNSSYLRILVKDLDFVLSAIENEGFYIDNDFFEIDSKDIEFNNFSIEESHEILDYYKKIVNLLEILHCKKELDLSSLGNQDWQNIDCLITTLIDKKTYPLTIKNDFQGVGNLTIGPLNFKVCFIKDKNSKEYNIIDFFDKSLTVGYTNKDGNESHISQYAVLQAKEIVEFDNIPLEKALESFKENTDNTDLAELATKFLLELITAYDVINKQEILNVAEDFAVWLMDIDNESNVNNLLNYLQIQKRKRILTLEEQNQLYTLIENNNSEEVKVAAYLLLGQQIPAEIHFKRMDKTVQEIFKKYPIFHFWSEGEE